MTQRELYIRDFFENNSLETLSIWSDNLKYFYYKRSSRGYSDEINDYFYCVIKDVLSNDVKCLLDILNIKTIEIEKGEQEISELNRSDNNNFYYRKLEDAFKWINHNNFTFFLRLTDSSLELKIPSHIIEWGAKLTDADFKNCLYLENIIDKANLNIHIDRSIEKYDSVFTKDKFTDVK